MAEILPTPAHTTPFFIADNTHELVEEKLKRIKEKAEKKRSQPLDNEECEDEPKKKKPHH
jgi:hypothetical protein